MIPGGYKPKTMFYRIVPSSGGWVAQTWGEGLDRKVLATQDSEFEAEDAARAFCPKGYYYERVW